MYETVRKLSMITFLSYFWQKFRSRRIRKSYKTSASVTFY